MAAATIKFKTKYVFVSNGNVRTYEKDEVVVNPPDLVLISAKDKYEILPEPKGKTK